MRTLCWCASVGRVAPAVGPTSRHGTRQVWSGSGDKTIAAHDARPGSAPSTLFSLGEQGGYVKALMTSGWTVWALTSAACKVGSGGDWGRGWPCEKLAGWQLLYLELCNRLVSGAMQQRRVGRRGARGSNG